VVVFPAPNDGTTLDERIQGGVQHNGFLELTVDKRRAAAYTQLTLPTPQFP
jgi:hypothetical protein